MIDRARSLLLSIGMAVVLLLLLGSTVNAQESGPWLVPMPIDNTVFYSYTEFESAEFGADADCTWSAGVFSCSGTGLSGANFNSRRAGGAQWLRFRGYNSVGIQGVRFKIDDRSPGLAYQTHNTWVDSDPGSYHCFIFATGNGVDSDWWTNSDNCDSFTFSGSGTLDDVDRRWMEETADGGAFSFTLTEFEMICGEEGGVCGDNAPPNIFGLTCTYTNTVGITQTVSASRVQNGSFEVFNYGSLPSGWTVSSPGSTFYAATDNSYDGDTSLQYQPNSGRLFAQACRSVGIEADTQSIAAGFYLAGGGSGTSDVTLLLDGEVLGTTIVSGSADWASLTVTSTNDSENLFQQFCIEVQGANRAYIDAAWLYTSDSNDLFGLQCPAPTDDVVPPPPPPPPENSDDGIPTPAPEDLGTCYRCIRPISIIQIGSWIKWLLCGLQNLFRCELYLWLLRIQNLIGGLVGQFVALVLWLPDGFQIGLNWFGSAINGSVDWLLSIWNNFRSGFTQFLFGLVQRVLETDFVQAMWTAATWVRAMWEYAWSLIQGVLATIGSVFGAAIQVIEMIGSIITGVAGAWTAPGYRIDFIPGIGGPGGGGDIMTAIEADGINDAKVYWILVSGLAALDAIAGDFGFQYLQYLLIGALAFGVIAWSLKQFQDFLPA